MLTRVTPLSRVQELPARCVTAPILQELIRVMRRLGNRRPGGLNEVCLRHVGYIDGALVARIEDAATRYRLVYTTTGWEFR